jgi:Transglutaminase-like superfamily
MSWFPIWCNMACWKSAKGKWAKLRLLPWPLRQALLQALCLLPLVRLGLRCFGFQRCQCLIERCSRNVPPLPADLVRAQALARDLAAVVRAAAGVTGGTCLRQSLVLWYLLRRRGIPCQLRIGGTVEAGQFAAHAWVEYAGESLDPIDPLQRFSVFQKVPADTKAEPNP